MTLVSRSCRQHHVDREVLEARHRRRARPRAWTRSVFLAACALTGEALDILSACDIRIAAKGTLFSIREVQVGLAADIGTLQCVSSIRVHD